jgi:hypothetical protein
MAKIEQGSQVFHFYELDSASIPKVQAFQAQHLNKFNITFGPTPATASIEWSTPEQLQLLVELAKNVANEEK